MSTLSLRDQLERHQIPIYFSAISAAALCAYLIPGTAVLEAAINPALAVMLFVTFLQVPLVDFGRAMLDLRFITALLVGNFIVVPLLVLAIFQFLPGDAMLRLGVLLVLLTPCIDYVLTFSHLGRADTRLLMAATPTLLIMQMVLLPIYLRLFLGDAITGLIHIGPFIDAFVWLIAVPLLLAALLQWCAARRASAARIARGLGFLPVPATTVVLFVIVMAVFPQLESAMSAVARAAPFFLAFAVLAPVSGALLARAWRLTPALGRALAFSTGTRNSLVILPLALAVPGAMPILPAVIVTQTMVELLAQLVYIRAIPKLLR